ncbi:MAG: hypothetical protein KGL03_12470, partial [Nitrospirota bacterium]|nr:hypothetical protein [Nitrospirota bacterium]
MFLVAVGLLVVFEAPTHLLWMVELGVTEWGYWLVPVALFCAGWPCRDRWPASADRRWRWVGPLGRLLAFIGALLFLSPLVWA